MKEYKLKLTVTNALGEVEEDEVTLCVKDEDSLRDCIEFWKTVVNAEKVEVVLVE